MDIDCNDFSVLRKMIYLKQYISYKEIMIEQKLLNHFLTLCETLHFGKASQALHISPSTLSRSIQQLEQQLHCELFFRDNRSVELTAEGEKLQLFARENIQVWQQLKESFAQGKQQLTGTISIYCSVTASYSFLHEVLKRFRLQHPKIEIILHTGDTDKALQQISSNQEDVAIAAKPRRIPSHMNFKRLGQTQLVMVVPRNIEFQKKFSTQTITAWSKQEWEAVPMILPEQGIFREYFDTWLNQQNFSPNIYAQVGGNEAIVSMVSLGFGIGVVPLIVVENSPLSEQVEVLETDANFDVVEIGFCARKKRLQSPIVQALWKSISYE